MTTDGHDPLLALLAARMTANSAEPDESPLGQCHTCPIEPGVTWAIICAHGSEPGLVYAGPITEGDRSRSGQLELTLGVMACDLGLWLHRDDLKGWPLAGSLAPGEVNRASEIAAEEAPEPDELALEPHHLVGNDRKTARLRLRLLPRLQTTLETLARIAPALGRQDPRWRPLRISTPPTDDQVEALLRRVEALDRGWHESDFDSALHLLDRLPSPAADDPRALMFRGYALFRLTGREVEGRDTLRRALALSVDDPEVYAQCAARLAFISTWSGDLEALELSRLARQWLPADAPTGVRARVIAMSAIALIEMDKSPEAPGLLEAAIDAYEAAGDIARAISVANDLARFLVRTESVETARANLASRLTKWDNASLSCEHAVAQLVSLWASLHEFDAALASLHRGASRLAFDLDTYSSALRAATSQALSLFGAEALPLVEHQVESARDPVERARFELMAGKLTIDRGERGRARATFETLLDGPLVPMAVNTAARTNLALLSLFAGEDAEARIHLARLPGRTDDVDPESASVIERVRALLAFNDDQAAEAIEHARSSLRYAHRSGLNEQVFFSQVSLVFQLISAGDLAEAAEVLDQLDGTTLPSNPTASELRTLLRCLCTLSIAAADDDIAGCVAAVEELGTVRDAFVANDNQPLVWMIDTLHADFILDGADALSLSDRFERARARLRDDFRAAPGLAFGH